MIAPALPWILDGGLATELEARGHDLNHHLWSARLLIENPRAIEDVQLAYFEAGADVVISASYQATIDGLMRMGPDRAAAEALIAETNAIARRARDRFLAGPLPAGRTTPMVAASIGPYGAIVPDGGEYRGKYGVAKSTLRDFHARRWELLRDADLFAVETIPCALEAEVLRELYDADPDARGWIAFSCKDAAHICDGTPVESVAALFADSPAVIAVGFNCTSPRYAQGLVERFAAALPNKTVVAYPNSGERYEGRTNSWHGTAESGDFAKAAARWWRAGAGIVGGCCRTGPEHIRAIRTALKEGGPAEA